MMRTRVRAGFPAVFAALGLLIAPGVASATTAAPAGDSFAATNSGNVTFAANNGTGTVVTCKTASFGGKVPASNNSLSGGAVHTTLTTIPAYSGCTAPNVSNLTITSNTTNGLWSLDVMDFPNPTATTSDAAAGDVAALGEPKASSTTTGTDLFGRCTIVSPPTEAAPVLGAWVDGTNSTTSPSTFSIKAQIDASFSGGFACLNSSAPVVEIAKYAVRDTTHSSSAITF